MTLFEGQYDATLEALVATFSGSTLEVWTFDDRTTRRAAETALAARGVEARCYSAYKPLVCAFRESIDTADLVSVEIVYPRHPAAIDKRFLLESYPLQALYPSVEFSFQTGDCVDSQPVYRLHLRYADGRESQLDVAAPNRVHTDFAGETSLSPCGWQVRDGEPARLVTAYERLFDEALTVIGEQTWGAEPHFERLVIAATLPIADEPLDYGDEVLSLREALHEEFYFSLLEWFQRRSGRPLGDRHLRPGQIVPEICWGDTYRVSVSVESHDQQPDSGAFQSLEAPTGPLSSGQIDAALVALGGEAFTATSVAGRPIEGRYFAGSDRAVIVSAGQHANETSSPAGTLQAARALLKTSEGAHFTLCPLENPDGYALHQRLIADNPRHMHHAARYTALGDDLEYRHGAEYETAIRFEAERLSQAMLHLNLHGYPAHEWTRPLSGYIPRGFEMWTIPKGFFLVVRHQAGWETAARALLDEVTRSLGEVPGLSEFNRRQIEVFEAHAGETGFETINGFACWVSEDARHRVPLTLITEYPDETVYGEAFQAGVAAQRATVLAAYRAFQDLPAQVFPA